jgi:hypothetical protein
LYSTHPSTTLIPSATPTVSLLPSALPSVSQRPSFLPSGSLVPSQSPSKSPPICVDNIEAIEVGHEGTLGELQINPIEIVGVDPNAFVAFRVNQTIIQGAADYFSVMYECLCIRFQDASSSDSYPELIGECVDGEATVSLYLQDISLAPGNDVDIPSMCNPFNTDPPNAQRVAYHFRLPCDQECITPDRFTASPTAVPDGEPTSEPTDTAAPTTISENSCDKAVIVGYEDFESGSAPLWNNGVVSFDPSLSRFLGRMGKEENRVDKTFLIATESSSVTVEFILYEIDQWEPEDKFSVIINNNRIDLGQFYETDIEENLFNYESGSKFGISWLRYSITPSMNVAFNETFADQAHKVELYIPPIHFDTGNLNIDFSVDMDDNIENESVGMDNIKVTANGLCYTNSSAFATGSVIPSRSGPNRLLDENERLSKLNAQVYDTGNEIETSYCSAKEYPCEEGKVNICHFNPHLGYQTFCVSEEESDIVKFYINSYCGPCVGGFGGKWF